jgi:predicted DNA-binding transcriptional regulator YafY
VLPALQDAVAHDRQIRFVYERSGVEPYERTVDPLGLVWKQSIWYVVARTARGMRTYRVSRMRDVAVLPSQFQRPEFDLGEYWRGSTAALEDLRQRYTAELLLTREAEDSLRRWLPVSMGEGTGVATVRFESMGQAQFICLGLGSAVDVISPPELREAVASEAQKMAGRVKRRSRRRA